MHGFEVYLASSVPTLGGEVYIYGSGFNTSYENMTVQYKKIFIFYNKKKMYIYKFLKLGTHG